MTSESDEFIIEDSDESLLDIKEINDLDFDIPEVAPPSLEKVLWDMESEEGSDTVSLHSFQSMTTRFRSMMSHCVLQGVSTQVSSALERVNAGLPTVITNSLKFVAIGTSHGYILVFDSEQNLCWCYHDVIMLDQGAVSALAFNLESTRILVGYERGFISMLDAKTGDLVRKLPDAHAPQTAVLHLRFTFLSNFALCGDSSGCVFSLGFGRRLGVRTWDSKCLFSGARGEVCVFEPLIQGHDINFLSRHILVAMATLSKVIVISVRPRLKVHFSQQLPKISTSLPLISWQLVSIGKAFQPVLAWGRGNCLHYTRLITNFSSNSNNRIRLMPLRNVQLPYTLTALHWLGTRHLALLDTNENLRLIEVRTQRELELLELSNAGLVYNSAHFKALAVGGGVSEAFALAGERACYNSLSSRGTQLLVLGTKAVHMVKLRTWPERIFYLSDQGRWSEALNLATEEGLNKESFTLELLRRYLESLNQNTVDKDSLTAAINCCVRLEKIDILCDDLLEAVSIDPNNLDWYYTLLTDHICNGGLKILWPSVCQTLVTNLEHKDPQLLESVLLSLDISCLDLHQVLTVCKRLKLYNAWIHITTKTLGDYAGPLIEFLCELTPDNNRLGNTMLVYVSSCLAGLGYPTGTIPENDIPRVKYDVLRCLETLHSVNGKSDEGSYPYLRALLRYNTRECLNVVELAFTEAEFSGEMGLLQRQRLICILLEIVSPPEFTDNQIINLACFISRLVISNNLTIDEAMLNSVIKSLTDVSRDTLSLRDHAEKEQAWIDLLEANKLSHFDKDELLRMALKSKCYRVAERMYVLQKDYGNILQCYLNDTVRRNEVFNYIISYIDVPERCVAEQFLVHFKDLLAINCENTVDSVIEYFPDKLETFCEIVDSENELRFSFLKGLVSNDVKLPYSIAEHYLEEVCIRDKSDACDFVSTNMCRIEEALIITRKYEANSATALLLEQSGEWMEALNILIVNDLIDEAVALCIRGAEHIDPEGAQKLWLTLLQSKRSVKKTSLRQLLHAAAPHVPPSQLLDLVSNAHYGDIKQLVQGMLNDYKHDIDLLKASFKVLDTDLHSELAKKLHANGKGVSVSNLTCNLCQKSLSYRKELQTSLSIHVWSCGHCFHTNCVRASESNDACLICRTKAKLYPKAKKDSNKNQYRGRSILRPDLEGHF
ncbi:vacuolar protein sorting-associated protein 8 homolog [Sitophilus oryzae]|uniref:Vacuolar protein sorting-associated protein 8 homolog n=1 Tax=Sitophilus oryzae TaxID=7048 RepID=A0A6J2XRX3_SITOR|nr:vacuolar protein sorting-associated protein 8 homolog [Sitophilus oryzae]